MDLDIFTQFVDLAATQPMQARRQATQRLFEELPCAGSASFTPICCVDEPERCTMRYGAIVAGGDDHFREVVEARRGKTLAGRPTTNVRDLPAEERNRFTPVDLTSYAGTKLHEEALEHLGIKSVVRAFLYERRRCVGWIGVFGRERCPPLSESHVADLDQLIPTLSRLFGATLDIGEPESATIDPDGEVRHATPAAWRLLSDPEMLRGVRDCVEVLESTDREHLRELVGTRVVGLARLRGEDGGARYSAHFEVPALPRLSPDADLTDRQRDVADLAADGLTNPQIASRLGIARETVKSHLTNIYRRLGVTSRRDLMDYLRG